MRISGAKEIYNDTDQVLNEILDGFLDVILDGSDMALEGESNIDSDWEYESDGETFLSEPEIVLPVL